MSLGTTVDPMPMNAWYRNVSLAAIGSLLVRKLVRGSYRTQETGYW